MEMKPVQDDAILDSLKQTLVGTLEDFAFVFAEIDSGDAPPTLPADDYISAVVAFTGSAQCGELQVAVPVAQAKEIAANVLGLEPEDVGDTETIDAIKEWSNIVAGALTATLFGVETTFLLSAPSATAIKPDDVMRFQQLPGAVKLLTDGNPVVALLKFS